MTRGWRSYISNEDFKWSGVNRCPMIYRFKCLTTACLVQGWCYNFCITKINHMKGSRQSKWLITMKSSKPQTTSSRTWRPVIPMQWSPATRQSHWRWSRSPRTFTPCEATWTKWGKWHARSMKSGDVSISGADRTPNQLLLPCLLLMGDSPVKQRNKHDGLNNSLIRIISSSDFAGWFWSRWFIEDTSFSTFVNYPSLFQKWFAFKCPVIPIMSWMNNNDDHNSQREIWIKIINHCLFHESSSMTVDLFMRPIWLRLLLQFRKIKSIRRENRLWRYWLIEWLNRQKGMIIAYLEDCKKIWWSL